MRHKPPFFVFVVALGWLMLMVNLTGLNRPELQSIAPYPTAPLCPSHDPTVAHGLWDSGRGCHYDHEHGDDPSRAAAFLGVDPVAFIGQGVSYPWATPGEAEQKHEGYKWTVRPTNEDPCVPESGENGTDGFAVEFHAKGHGPEHLTRNHSAFIAAVVCNLSGGRGVLLTGGWQDYGQRISPYQGLVLALSDQPQPSYPTGLPPYLSLGCNNCGAKAGPPSSTWTSLPTYITGGNQLAQLLFRVRDPSQSINGATRTNPPQAFTWVCGGALFNPIGCKANNTTGTVHQVFGYIPPEWDELDGVDDDAVTYQGYTDRWGHLVEGCEAQGLDCVPLYLSTVPVGHFSTTFDNAVTAFSAAALPDRDICFTPRTKTSPGGQLVNCDVPNAVPSGWAGPNN